MTLKRNIEDFTGVVRNIKKSPNRPNTIKMPFVQSRQQSGFICFQGEGRDLKLFVLNNQ